MKSHICKTVKILVKVFLDVPSIDTLIIHSETIEKESSSYPVHSNRGKFIYVFKYLSIICNKGTGVIRCLCM